MRFNTIEERDRHLKDIDNNQPNKRLALDEMEELLSMHGYDKEARKSILIEYMLNDIEATAKAQANDKAQAKPDPLLELKSLYKQIEEVKSSLAKSNPYRISDLTAMAKWGIN